MDHFDIKCISFFQELQHGDLGVLEVRVVLSGAMRRMKAGNSMARHYRSLDENDTVLWMLAKNDRHAPQLFDLDDGTKASHPLDAISEAKGGKAVTSEPQIRCKT
jgi:hypothetical protein